MAWVGAARQAVEHMVGRPFTVRPPMSGLTATKGTRRDSIVLRIPATARIGRI